MAQNDWVVQNMGNTIVDNSKSTYAPKIASLLRYCEKHCPAMLHPDFVRDIVRDKSQEIATKYVTFQLYTCYPPRPTIVHDAFDKRIVHNWLSTLKGKDGEEMASNSSYNTARSAIRQLFVRYNLRVPDDYQQETASLLAGVKRTNAKRKQAGETKIVEGKSAMSFQLYCMIARELLRCGDVFSHLFLVVSWNLMCRASNTDGLKMQHLEWQGDSLKIFFGMQKNDQDGTRNMDPRHCYANPAIPEISIVLALAIYFLCYRIPAEGNARLFEGSNQYQRFVKALKGVMKRCPEIEAKMERCGLTPKDIAAHSTRKGGRSYCAGGSTNGPAFVTIMMRGGWTLEGIDKRYVRFERAGDQYVGRILAGLNVNTADFALLPPFFSNADDSVMVALDNCFPNCPARMQSILLFALASVVHHQDFLREVLPRDHPVFSTPAFASGIAESLRGRVECRVPRSGDRLDATGIPSHVLIMGKMEALEQKMAALPNQVHEKVKEFFDGRDHGETTLARVLLLTCRRRWSADARRDGGNLGAAVGVVPCKPRSCRSACSRRCCTAGARTCGCTAAHGEWKDVPRAGRLHVSKR